MWQRKVHKFIELKMIKTDAYEVCGTGNDIPEWRTIYAIGDLSLLFRYLNVLNAFLIQHFPSIQ